MTYLAIIFAVGCWLIVADRAKSMYDLGAKRNGNRAMRCAFCGLSVLALWPIGKQLATPEVPQMPPLASVAHASDALYVGLAVDPRHQYHAAGCPDIGQRVHLSRAAAEADGRTPHASCLPHLVNHQISKPIATPKGIEIER